MEQIYLDYLAQLLPIWAVIAMVAASALIFFKGLDKILDEERLGVVYILISIFLLTAVFVAIATV